MTTTPRRSKIALVGNPNSGKSSLFNHLTGLNQKIGNFPGVTVEKKTGVSPMPDGSIVEIIDLPGIYSIYPRSLDERIVAEVLLDHHSPSTPDKVIVIVDGTNLKRGFLLLTQIIDLGLPAILALNMMDLAAKAALVMTLTPFQRNSASPLSPINARNGIGMEELRKEIVKPDHHERQAKIFNVWKEAEVPVKELRTKLGVDNDYEAYQFLEQPSSLKFLSKDKQDEVALIRTQHQFFPGKFQGAKQFNGIAIYRTC
jgi:ferrous iron transport protein B